MTTPIASGVGVGTVPTTTPSTGFSGSSDPRETENISAIKTVQSTDKAGSGAAAGQAGNNASNAGFSERTATRGPENSNYKEDLARSRAIAPDVSIGPSPAFVTSVLEAANSEALAPATEETEGIRETEARDTGPGDAGPGDADADVVVTRSAPTEHVGAQVQADPAPDTQSQPFDDPARESFNLARGFAAQNQKPSVDEAA